MSQDQTNKIASPIYLSYLVRLWRSTNSQTWLASLEAPGTHEIHRFADLASFIAFLQDQTGDEGLAREASDKRETLEHSTTPPEPP